MRVSSVCVAAVFGAISTAAQDQPPRDAHALVVLQQSIAAMGGAAPADSVATGRITIVAGSKTDSGTIRILSRGLDQSAEQVETQDSSRALTYSRRSASLREGAFSKRLQLELVVSSHSANFPLVLLAEAFNDATSAFQYVGVENVDSGAAHHIRFWKTFSDLKLQHLSEFSSKDIWIDVATLLPLRLFCVQRAARGDEVGIPMEITYSDFRNVGGALYPFQIRKSMNGTPWVAIIVESVALNTGLTDREFPVR